MAGAKIAIDLGSSAIKYALCPGASGASAALATVDAATGKVLATGEAATEPAGRESAGIRTVFAMKDGGVANYALTRYLLRQVIDRLLKNRLLKPEGYLGVSASVSELEKKILSGLLMEAGARRVCFVNRAAASAIDSGWDPDKPAGAAVLDIGSGTAECAVTTGGGVAIHRSAKTAGDAMTGQIQRYLREERGVEIGFSTAEQIKKTLACAVMRTEEIAMIAAGKRVSGEAVNFEINSTEVRFLLKDCFYELSALVSSTFRDTPPQLLGDISQNGLILTGGSAQIYGLADSLARTLGVPVHVPGDPAMSVVRGIAKAVKKKGDAKNRIILSER